jgi:hypothetical protein
LQEVATGPCFEPDAFSQLTLILSYNLQPCLINDMLFSGFQSKTLFYEFFVCSILFGFIILKAFGREYSVNLLLLGK